MKDHQRQLEYTRKWANENREKLNALNREWKQKHPGSHRDSYLKRRFGISLDDYNNMLFKQDNKCVLCGRSQESMKLPLYVDHDHTTNKIRGLLCHYCNVMLGMSGDNPQRLRDGADYIEKHKI